MKATRYKALGGKPKASSFQAKALAQTFWR